MKTNHLSGMLFLLTILFSTAFSGCGNEEAAITTPNDVQPFYYTTEEEIPSDTYCIVHTEGENVYYYPLYLAEKTYTDVYTSAQGENASRVFWVNYNTDEGLIPTMYPGDKLIYKSNNYIPTTYFIEKFFDNGYTVGICGLKQDLSGNYKYNINDGGYTLTTTDAVGIDSLTAESIYLVSVGDERVTSENVSYSGTVTGLDLMETYECDIRTGTEKITGMLTANAHYFSSAECYVFGEFTFITPYIAELNIPDYVTTGYYDINGAGYFRYLDNEKSYEKLTAQDYNETIYEYDENWNVIGTKDGLVFDENFFLVEDVSEDVTETLDYEPEYVYLDTTDDVHDTPEEIDNTEETTETEDIENIEETEVVEDTESEETITDTTEESE